jgi:hypothetical protein
MHPRGGSHVSLPGVVAAAFLAIAVASSTRAADPPAVRLTWARGQDADGCPSGDEIQRQVQARLGRNPFADDAPRSIDTMIDRVDGVWHARIHVRDERGRSMGARDLTSESKDCTSIQAAAVLAIALTIDPNAPMHAPPSSSAPASASAPPSSSAPPAVLTAAAPTPIAPQSAPPAAHHRRVHDPTVASVTLRGGGAMGLVPGSTIGIGWSGSIPIAHDWLVAAHALWTQESKPTDQRFAFGLTAFGLGACYEPGSARWLHTGACATAWLGSIHAVVYEIRPTEPGGRLYSAVSLSPYARASLYGPLHAQLGVELFVPTERRSFTVTGWQDPVWRQPAAAVFGYGGLGMHFR